MLAQVHDGDDKNDVTMGLVDNTIGKAPGAATAGAQRERMPSVWEMKDASKGLLNLGRELIPQTFALIVIVRYCLRKICLRCGKEHRFHWDFC